MKHSYFVTLLCAIPLFVSSCANSIDSFVKPSHSHIHYEGRIGNDQADAAQLFWPGTSITINFEGKEIGAWFKDETGNNYYNIIIDNDSIFQVNPDTTKRLYTLASNLSEGPHTVTIFKRTSWDKGKAWFYGFDIKEGKTLAPPQPKKRKIEFYGNSITTGYAMEDLSGDDSPDGKFENNYRTYAAITARHFDAAYSCIAKAGIGITVSWDSMIMPEIYDRINPYDSTSKWDFSKYTPQIVVINLFQNDSWLVNMPENEQFKIRFGTTAPDSTETIEAYGDFLKNIREKYPDAHIICSLGNMDATKEGSPWPGYIESAVGSMQDDKLHTLFFPFKDTPGHPTAAEQEAMAKSLIRFIENNIDW